VGIWGGEPECGQVYVPASQAIIALVGSDFYGKYISPQSAKYFPPSAHCIKHPEACAEYMQRPYCMVTFKFRMPETHFVDEVISCIVDPDGKVSDLSGVPPCIASPLECVFPYNDATAREVAGKAGLEPGIKPWSVSFTWNRQFGYVWGVSNTLHESKYGADGRSVLIDANDGRVLGVFGWVAGGWVN
jgi:hypothetical protein